MCICVTDSAKIEEADNDDDDGHDGDANDDHGDDDVGADAGGGHCCSAVVWSWHAYTQHDS